MTYMEEYMYKRFIEENVLEKELRRIRKKLSCIKCLEVSDVMLMCSYTSKTGKAKYIFLDKRKNKTTGVPSARDKKVMEMMLWIRERCIQKIGL